MRVAVVGLGKMGSAIARHLLDAGNEVHVWNRSPRAADALVAAGAKGAGSIQQIATSSTVILVSLWGDDEARAVTLQQLIPAMPRDPLLIEMSTLSPEMYLELGEAARAHGVDFLAAPVLGSVGLAATGSLLVFVSGDQHVFERAGDLLKSIGSSVIYAGPLAASGFLKLGCNTIIGVFTETMRELLEFCERGGVDRALSVNVLTGAFGRIASSKTEQLLEQNWEARFSLDALLKDLHLARKTAKSMNVPVPVLNAVVIPAAEEGVAQGLGDRDYIALAAQKSLVP